MQPARAARPRISAWAMSLAAAQVGAESCRDRGVLLPSCACVQPLSVPERHPPSCVLVVVLGRHDPALESSGLPPPPDSPPPAFLSSPLSLSGNVGRSDTERMLIVLANPNNCCARSKFGAESKKCATGTCGSRNVSLPSASIREESLTRGSCLHTTRMLHG